jgi:hypothetical protein
MPMFWLAKHKRLSQKKKDGLKIMVGLYCLVLKAIQHVDKYTVVPST